jgi:hypothetical protein
LHVDQTTFRSFQNRSNNYGLDRAVQKTESYSGIDGINQQDRALQESMGPIVDRSREMLGPADKAIIQARKLLREAVKDVEAGRSPAGTGTSYYTVFARDADWHRALAPDITKDRILQRCRAGLITISRKAQSAMTEPTVNSALARPTDR